ncbi:hypothetical protein [Streptomyces sp. NBC_00385]|uniref:hypothetical protein n=1 Tax=Streptomyces sp. NBC_00385 TaxID=2975733 RepID=UPI002DD98410|nr:hypothetical protein [Streptomyces sp. NBC_00385]WRZ08502.1 hypothetical protein OG959_36720 [Streptomyces sp. NBC_00385]
MARVLIEGTDIVVRLSWREKAAARRREVRVPLSALRHVYVEPDWWRALRGERESGTCVPGRLCAGIRRHREGQDFTLVRSGGPVLCVELHRSAQLSRLAVSVPDAEETRRRLSPTSARGGA